ncbi:hypothetical protein V2I29_04310 [Campylobacter sp. CX2-8023-23]|uniref:hypothetical protein n=1 Tax=Campylobacter porcelli TaxID=1660073 RepID=UPI002ECF8AD0|nr:hypothetical protein [Campylobacter sp. CX2-8023-23]
MRLIIPKENKQAKAAKSVIDKLKQSSTLFSHAIKDFEYFESKLDNYYELREEAWEAWHEYNKIRNRLIEAIERL